jgi:hypothetical protein
MTMYRKQNQILKRIENNYLEGGAWIDDEGNKMPRDQAEAQAVFGISQRMTELESSIARHKLGVLKLELDRDKMALEQRRMALAEWNRHPLTRSERIARTAELLDQRARESLSATETAYLFSREDLDLPPALHAEMLKEITWLEPATEHGGGITPEELERETRAYMEKRQFIRDKWMPERALLIEGVIANEAAHLAGELLGEGDFANVGAEDPDKGEVVLIGDDGTWTQDDVVMDDDDPEAYE